MRKVGARTVGRRTGLREEFSRLSPVATGLSPVAGASGRTRFCPGAAGRGSVIAASVQWARGDGNGACRSGRQGVAAAVRCSRWPAGLWGVLRAARCTEWTERCRGDRVGGVGLESFPVRALPPGDGSSPGGELGNVREGRRPVLSTNGLFPTTNALAACLQKWLTLPRFLAFT